MLVPVGKAVQAAIEAAVQLEEEGISCGIVNPLFIKPLDVELLVEQARRTGRVVTVEENVLAGGFGSAVLETFAEEGLSDVLVHRVGMPDAFVEHGTAADQRHWLKLDAEGIVQQVRGAFFGAEAGAPA